MASDAPPRPAAASEIPVEDQHQFLDLAKQFEWDEVERRVKETPGLINVQPAGRWSALHQAAFSGFPDAVLHLLESKADLNAKTNDDRTPYEVAKNDVVKRLLVAEEEEESSPSAKKRKVEPKEDKPAEDKPVEEEEKKSDPKSKEMPGYELNLNAFLMKHAETYFLGDIADKPVDVLQGLAALAKEALNARGVKTVRDLANWKFYKIAQSLVTLRAAHVPGERDPDTQMNVNKALDKKWETKPLDEIVNAPIGALQGLTKADEERFAKVHVKTIADLGTWKFPRWAEAIVCLAQYESADHSS